MNGEKYFLMIHSVFKLYEYVWVEDYLVYMVFDIQWAGLAFSKYLLFLSFIYADFFFLLVADNQSVHYPEKLEFNL